MIHLKKLIYQASIEDEEESLAVFKEDQNERILALRFL